MTERVRATAPGRVNLIGDHTDHTGGFVLPMAIDLATTVTGERGGDVVALRSTWTDEVARVPLSVTDPATVTPGWARYVAGVVVVLRPSAGFTGEVASTIPVGAGLSSSAALEVALALALGFDGAPVELARASQRAEHEATGVPCGIMDQLASAAGVAGAALRIDCHSLDVRPVALPAGLAVLVVHSGESRALAGSAYAERAAACRAAEAVVGPLRSARLDDLAAIDDPVVRRRARHVVTENARVSAMLTALGASDQRAVGALMAESHTSLRDDYECSTPALDHLVAELQATPGIIGARQTGAGWGGCAVALAEEGATPPEGYQWWRVRPSAGAAMDVAT